MIYEQLHEWLERVRDVATIIFGVYFVALMILSGITVFGNEKRADKLLPLLLPLHFAWVIPLTVYILAVNIGPILVLMLAAFGVLALLMLGAWIVGIMERRRKRR